MREKPLKKGFTTGAAAAAAARAALVDLLTGKSPDQVPVRCLNDQVLNIAVHQVTRVSDTVARALVIKDAGDDPDVTHKAKIGAEIEIIRHDPVTRRGNHQSDGIDIEIIGGKGVGQVTRPGLEIPPGRPAINPGPLKMIRESVMSALDSCTHYKPDMAAGSAGTKIRVTVFVPRGEELAEKTLNRRLGILGGISILGTTGIVRPMSHDSYIATIRSGISVARAMDQNTLVLTTGRRSERFAMDLMPDLHETVFIQIGDFFKAALETAADGAPEIRQVILTVFFGKAVKMAMGFPHTHAAKSELTLNRLAGWAGEITGSRQLEQSVQAANTARHAFDYIHPDYPELIGHVGDRIRVCAAGFSKNRLKVEAVIFDFEGRPVYDSRHQELTKKH